MASTQPHHHLTPEEFATSPTPPPTLLLPRLAAWRLVELCEGCEHRPSPAFLELAGVASSNGASNGGSAAGVEGGGGHPHGAVVQMAFLLSLGEYVHARHVWRRHRPSNSSGSSTVGASGGNAAEGNVERSQLEQLWSAGRYLLLWDTGGIDALTADVVSAGGNDGMQVEDDGDDDDEDGEETANGNWPYSTLALRALATCQKSGREPVATYAHELAGMVRSRVNERLLRSFATMDEGEFCLRLDLPCLPPGAEGAQPWEEFGWKKAGGHLTPDDEFVLEVDGGAEGLACGEESGGERIGKLTDVVLFLEGRVNA